jgi:hypothetical protein
LSAWREAHQKRRVAQINILTPGEPTVTFLHLAICREPEATAKSQILATLFTGPRPSAGNAAGGDEEGERGEGRENGGGSVLGFALSVAWRCDMRGAERSFPESHH